MRYINIGRAKHKNNKHCKTFFKEFFDLWIFGECINVLEILRGHRPSQLPWYFYKVTVAVFKFFWWGISGGFLNYKTKNSGAPGWLNQLSGRLQLRSWTHGSWVRAPCPALCWQLRVCSLLPILCLPLSLPLLHSHSASLSLSLSQK